ncbi:MAG: hypothetical protein ACREDC_06165 [Bradyrhizobium sp.]
MGWLKAPAFALALVLSPFTAGFAHAAPAVRAHVFFVRGFLNVFSLGLDEMATTLRRQGIHATVSNHLLWASIADDAAAEYKSGRINTIILVGHSSGATVLPKMIARLSRERVPVKLAIGLDSIFHTSLSGRVGEYINYYVADGAGTRVRKTRNFHGILENINVDTVPGVGHLTIDKNPIMQQRVIAAIDAAAHHRPGIRAARRPRAMPIAASHALGAKRAAAAN